MERIASIILGPTRRLKLKLRSRLKHRVVPRGQADKLLDLQLVLVAKLEAGMKIERI